MTYREIYNKIVDLKLYDNIKEFKENESKLLEKDDFEIKFLKEQNLNELES